MCVSPAQMAAVVLSELGQAAHGDALALQSRQDFLGETRIGEVLGQQVPVASLANVIRGKIWAWSDESRRPIKRKKDELDLMRILEAYPEMRSVMPKEIRAQLPETD